LNLYAEADSPKDFYTTLIVLFIFMLVLFGVGLGSLGYLAFGNSCKSVILYNLPNGNPEAIVAKVFYIITLMGSYVIVI